MSSEGSLLRARQGKEGSFVRWLEDLGLKDFLGRYPLRQLVEWGWLVPQSRIVFPKEFVDAYEEFRYQQRSDMAGFKTQGLLWDSYWFVDGNKESLWFLDPFFHPSNEAREILLGNGVNITAPLPEDVGQSNGYAITPYVDFFFHWQGYALIDVIRAADCIAPILNTPDVRDRAQGVVRIAESIADWDPERVLTLPNRWGGLSGPMTWLSHYRSFREALNSPLAESDPELQRQGAKELASYLGVTADSLAQAIKDKLLVLAQDWIWANERYCIWTLRAYPRLQWDIAMAVEWLCYLSGKTFAEYLELWQYKRFMGKREWAELHTVLEYEFFTDKKRFIQLTPEYFKPYGEVLPFINGLEAEHLKQVVDKLLSRNYPFGSFLGAFRQLHDELSHRFDRNGKLDFRELRPLDYYSLLAIRAEGCLRFALEQNGTLGKQQKLSQYVECLAKHRGLSATAIAQYKANLKITQLYDTPDDPIGKIMALSTGLSGEEHFLVQAFLCCELARNYFAHHSYLDQKLVNSKESGFMLTGILITVLYLLGENS